MSSTSTRASRGIFYEPDACIQAFSRTVVAPSGFLHFMKQLWRAASYAEPERGGIPVPNVFLPNVTIPTSDFPRLKRLARTAAERGRDADALFLMSELKRAEVVPDCSARLRFYRHHGIVGDVLDQLGISARDKAIGVSRRLHVGPNPTARVVAIGCRVGRPEGRKRNPLLRRGLHQHRQDR